VPVPAPVPAPAPEAKTEAEALAEAKASLRPSIASTVEAVAKARAEAKAAAAAKSTLMAKAMMQVMNEENSKAAALVRAKALAVPEGGPVPVGVVNLQFHPIVDPSESDDWCVLGSAMVALPLKGGLEEVVAVVGPAVTTAAMALKDKSGRLEHPWDTEGGVTVKSHPFSKPTARRLSKADMHAQGVKFVGALLGPLQLALRMPHLCVALHTAMELEGVSMTSLDLPLADSPGPDAADAETAEDAEDPEDAVSFACDKLKEDLRGNSFPVPHLLLRAMWEQRTTLHGTPAHVAAVRLARAEGRAIPAVTVVIRMDE
jgi:hypothetical protein